MEIGDFDNKVIFITGAGSIGSEILKQILNYNIKSVRILDNSELKLHNLMQEYKQYDNIRYLLGDIRDKDRLKIGMRGVDIVFHTAALKHVSFCENNPIDALKTNVIGTQNIIDVAIREKVDKLINISTDKATNPINVMGATKLLAERITVSASKYKGNIKTVFTTVRFGNVLGSSGSVIPIFKKLIKENKELTITNEDMTRFIMTIEDAVKLIFYATTLSKDEEIFILKMPSINIMDLAKAMIQKYNKDVGIKIIGMQNGEKIHESLITREESVLAYENDKLIVIPSIYNIKHFESLGFTKMKIGEITSHNNVKLTIEEIKELI